MAPKRALEDEGTGADSTSRPKKARSKFQIGPDNLPDGTYRRKVIKIKRDMIEKAKIKKSYAKLKAREPPIPTPMPTDPNPEPASKTTQAEPASQELHPDRIAMLSAPERLPTHDTNPNPYPGAAQTRQRNSRAQRPGYFAKETAYAEERRAEQEAKRAEWERRDKERKEKIEERDRFRGAMKKARTGGRNGQRKLGRESKVLLEKVRRVVGS